MQLSCAQDFFLYRGITVYNFQNLNCISFSKDRFCVLANSVDPGSSLFAKARILEPLTYKKVNSVSESVEKTGSAVAQW